MHAGFHFTSDKERRMAAGLDRLKRIVGHAERHGAQGFGALIEEVGSQQTHRRRGKDSNLYGAFPVKKLFLVRGEFFVRSG
jgi:hypothetical protein